jgi:uncharacterized protein
VKADPEVQLRLLDLQARDAALARLEHRRRTLSELAVIVDADTRLAALRADVVRAETEVGDLDRELRRLEDDVDQVRRRAERDQQRMLSGAVPAKELESLQHEVETLTRRQSDLEDTELEVMERREDAEARAGEVRAEVEKVTATRSEAEEARAVLADGLPADLMALYEKVRAASGGVGAAMLRQRRCEGCRLELMGAELRAAQAAPPDEVLRCENCRRILVRTTESGL